MKFYKAQSSEVGEGVEATVLYHKDNGDELVCVRSGFETFEEQNPDVEELAREDVESAEQEHPQGASQKKNTAG